MVFKEFYIKPKSATDLWRKRHLIAFYNAIFLFMVYNLCMKSIVCISGKQYSGKDTLAKVLLKYLPDFKRMAIGDSIKLEYGRIHNLTYSEIDSNKGIYRTGLIELGNWGRSIDADYWLKKLLENDKIIVPDVRLIHEADIFKSEGAFLIRVEASFNARSNRGQITNADDLTETELDNYKFWDYKIENNYGIVELEENALPLIEKIKEKFKI